MKGRLIVLEGIDGCGKGTQLEMLCKRTDCKVFKYPTQKFSMLNDYLLKKVQLDQKSLFLLFLADIANEQKDVSGATEKHSIVVLDRYVFSTIAYEKEGISFDEGEKIVEASGMLKPDMVILLDIPVSVSQERKSKQKKLDRYEENARYLEKVRQNFLRLHEERFLTPNWHKVDASRDAESVHKDIVKLLGLE